MSKNKNFLLMMVFFSMNQIFLKKMTNVFKMYVVENIYQFTDNYVLNYLITYFIYLSGWILYVLNCFNFLKKTLDHAQCHFCHALKLKQNEYYIYRYTHLCHCVEFFFNLNLNQNFILVTVYNCIHLSMTAIL